MIKMMLCVLFLHYFQTLITFDSYFSVSHSIVGSALKESCWIYFVFLSFSPAIRFWKNLPAVDLQSLVFLIERVHFHSFYPF